MCSKSNDEEPGYRKGGLYPTNVKNVGGWEEEREYVRERQSRGRQKKC